jgi:hypothetical protein
MSGQQPIRAQSRELEVLRVLFDRQLADRAVSLAESRWPGSGEMVKLAYDWAKLSPTERRERLSAIGPEEVARMRELASLNPEFDAVVQNLEQRGVLPHVEQIAASGVAAATAAYSSEPRLPIEVPDDMDEPAPSIDADAPSAQPEATAVAAPEVEAHVDAVTTAAQERIEQLRREAEELRRMDPADLVVEGARLETDSQQVAAFLSGEQQRRQQALADAQAALDRVRQRVERSSNKLLTQTDVSSRAAPSAAELPILRSPSDFGSLRAGVSRALPGTDVPNVTPAPERLAREFAGHVVVTLTDPMEIPTGDELIALANDMGLALREFVIEPGATRAIFGGLTRRGYQVEAQAGPLPSALAAETLAVVRGKLYPNLVERMQEGYADIPATRATVRMHPKSRVLVLVD